MSADLIESLRTARARGDQPSAPGANLQGANLRGADLWGANLWGADGDILAVPCGLPSGQALLVPTPGGWVFRVGCWVGTVEDLRILIAADDGWPEATGDEVARRRPILTALCDLADAHMAYNADVVPALAQKWGTA